MKTTSHHSNRNTQYTVQFDSLKIFHRGQKRYELSNHLGNVLAVITDRRIQSCGASDVMHYEAQVVSVSDYYPFGMGIKEREWSDSTFGYRFSFNGMERDDEVKGNGNSYTTEYRMLDVRLGRWFTTDPISHANMSPYMAMDNDPIMIVDPRGGNGDPDKKTGSIKATIFISSSTDAGQGVSQDQLSQAAFDIESNINNVYGGMNYKGNNVSPNVNVVQVTDAQMTTLENGGTITLTGDGWSQDYSMSDGLSNAIRIGQSGISNCATKNSGSWFLNDLGGNTAAHEFGHLLGLSDRYNEGRNFDPFNFTLAQSSRFTIPNALPGKTRRFGYNPSNNLMSTSAANLDADQLGYIFRGKQEKDYSSVFLTQRLDQTGAIRAGSQIQYQSILVRKSLFGAKVQGRDAIGNIAPGQISRNFEWMRSSRVYSGINLSGIYNRASANGTSSTFLQTVRNAQSSVSTMESNVRE